MPVRIALALAALVCLLSACGTKNHRYVVPSAEIPAGERSYRYAFSAQVVDEDTRTPISNFAADLTANNDVTVLNGLGNTDGIFHLSRRPSKLVESSVDVPLVVSSPGYEPAVQTIGVTADCEKVNCATGRPIVILLRKLAKASSQAIAAKSLDTTGLSTGVDNTQLLSALVASGKIDSRLANQLQSAGSSGVVRRVLVVLGGVSKEQAQTVAGGLLASIADSGGKFASIAKIVLAVAGQIAPLILSGSPMLATVLVAVNSLLPYLTPLITNIAANGGPIGKILAGFIASGNLPQNILALLQGLKDKKNIPQLAFATFLPIIQKFIEKFTQGTKERPFLNLILGALKDPRLMDLLGNLGQGGAKDKAKALLVAYAQPLIQALIAKLDPTLATLFNELIGKGGVAALESLPADGTRLKKFAKLLPYLEPILTGLKSKKDGSALRAALSPLLSSSNPAEAMKGILSAPQGIDHLSSVGTTLFPGAQGVVEDAVPQKQVFVSQLIQGMLAAKFQDLKVEEDVPNVAGVVVTGQVQDLLKLAQMPNVKKITLAN